ncbi:MAG: RNase adapter RapZ [Erythrobacter sp.]|nr:RNase adapter RapZ [Erythrobacter sp.]
MSSESNGPQQILLVTGMSGAGKSTALETLEDLGWEAIDNFPIRMLPDLLARTDDPSAPLAIGFDARTRGFVPNEIIDQFDDLAARPDLSIGTLFLDCASPEIERRYNETRRRHPLAHGRPVRDGIRAERELLAPLREWAQMVIDTSGYARNHLQQAIRERFAQETSNPLTITVTSFGFARGMPPIADLVFDMRFLDNPHWIEGLREQTGRDGPVAAHIASDPAFTPAFDKIADLVLSLIPRYAAQGRAYLTIAFGCTGGRHRSVFSAESMAARLRDDGYEPTVVHRDLAARAADTVEGPVP